MKCRRLIFSRNLAANEIQNALDVSKSELGDDYLTEKNFLETINSQSAFCKVVTYNRQFAGFAMCQVFGPEKIDEVLRLPDSPEKKDLLSKGKIGLLDSIAVRKDMQNNGMGIELSEACLKEFEARGVDTVCAMAWKNTGGEINIEGILRRMGMKSGPEIPGYWNYMVDSPGGHDCPVCGRPCKCSAVFYGRDV
ncbi:MAG: GNAT family N-acetyltransferase [Candidatus Methanoplasma sp.]|jgi:ribosomal protein S18 acetylase RimI-like enzyme|nr:GNAT family N-acetyltransferase [Candidatus Methanoplasma sp.]